MKDTRRAEEFLTTSSMITFIHENYAEWLDTYLSRKTSLESGRRALEQLLQRTADCCIVLLLVTDSQLKKRNRLSFQRIKSEFALEFWTKYGTYSESEIYNVDGTAIQFDLPPHKIWGIEGRKGSTKVQGLKKHTGCMTAVLTIRADGWTIDSHELDTHPSGHFYTVEEAGWMDATGWAFYAETLLKYEIDSPALLLADNFSCHVSEEGVRVVAEEACATVVTHYHQKVLRFANR
ncbi:hypothetical protein PHMEG_00011070 [Phytophthora megakarya]|uniref:DDE-1 domain-containing protein n=1 Tax=Phytophthora megakarya TaxID=4795 RepID=A0A225WC50_9STRA|nr:hypothetical protein PHMEG_00011070 [Phytophthora megakarya]